MHTSRCATPTTGMRTVVLPQSGSAQTLIPYSGTEQTEVFEAKRTAAIWLACTSDAVVQFETTGREPIFFVQRRGTERYLFDVDVVNITIGDVDVTSETAQRAWAWVEDTATLAPLGDECEED